MENRGELREIYEKVGSVKTHVLKKQNPNITLLSPNQSAQCFRKLQSDQSNQSTASNQAEKMLQNIWYELAQYFSPQQ